MKRVHLRRLLVWFVAAAIVVVGFSCATDQLEENDLFGFRPLPTIKGTDIPVPRSWAPSPEPRDWNWIVIHHSASDSGGAVVFDQWHRKRGWDELGYHFVIDNGDGQPDGRVEVGSRWLKQKQGAHAKSATGEYNDRGIGICLVGNFEKNPPTAAQLKSLQKLTTYLAREYDIPAKRIIGHKYVNDTTLCPGKHLDLEEVRRNLMP